MLKRFNCCPITCFEKTSDVQVIIGVLLAAAFYFRQPAGPEEQALRLQEVEIPVTCWRFKALSPCPFYFASCCLVFCSRIQVAVKKDLVHIGISSTSGFGWVLKSRSNANKEEWDFGLEKKAPSFQCFPTGTLTSSKEIRAVVWRKATPLDGGWGQKACDGPC